MRLAQGALAFEVPGYFENGFNFFFGEVKVANKIAAAEIGLHKIISCLVYAGHGPGLHTKYFGAGKRAVFPGDAHAFTAFHIVTQVFQVVVRQAAQRA